MQIHLTVDARECSYWNYENHTCTHTCRGCTCMSEGNHLSLCGDLSGVKIGEDRYCLLGDVEVKAKIIEAINRPDPIKAYWGRKITSRNEYIYTCSNCGCEVKHVVCIDMDRCPLCKAIMIKDISEVKE